MPDQFREISKRLERAAEQRISPLDEGVFMAMQKVESINYPGVEPTVDPVFLAGIVKQCVEKINELADLANLLTAHNIILEDKLDQVVTTINKHTSEIANSLERIIDIEPKEKE